MSKQDFKVFGDEKLLKNCKVNIVKIDASGTETKKTLLFSGRSQNVKSETETGVIYWVYISYKDSLVNRFEFENIMRNANDYINHIYIEEIDSEIDFKYVGREKDLTDNKGYHQILIPLERYFDGNKIEEKLKKKENEMFFNFFQ